MSKACWYSSYRTPASYRTYPASHLKKRIDERTQTMKRNNPSTSHSSWFASAFNRQTGQILAVPCWWRAVPPGLYQTVSFKCGGIYQYTPPKYGVEKKDPVNSINEIFYSSSLSSSLKRKFSIRLVVFIDIHRVCLWLTIIPCMSLWYYLNAKCVVVSDRYCRGKRQTLLLR